MATIKVIASTDDMVLYEVSGDPLHSNAKVDFNNAVEQVTDYHYGSGYNVFECEGNEYLKLVRFKIRA
jgi:hypothetical protein